MSKKLKYVLVVVLVVLVILQFVGPKRPATSAQNPGDIFHQTEIPSAIGGMLKTACYDCHSMETTYPWYGYIAPVSWFLISHIDEGREELNFSDWSSLDKRSKLRALKDIQEVIEEGEMPMASYVNMHSEAALSDSQKEALMDWAKTLSREVISN